MRVTREDIDGAFMTWWAERARLFLADGTPVREVAKQAFLAGVQSIAPELLRHLLDAEHLVLPRDSSGENVGGVPQKGVGDLPLGDDLSVPDDHRDQLQ